jgi:pyruvate dehydrogenase (quinone)
MVFLGNPEYVCDLQPIDFAMFERGNVIEGFTINTPSETGHYNEIALSIPGPALVEAIVYLNEHPMPAKIKPQQALHFAESLAKGTRDWQKIASTIAKDRVRELV